MNLFHSAIEKRAHGAGRTAPALMRFLLLTALLLAGLSLARPARAQSGVHTVTAGETLSEIAQRYGTDMTTLVSLNGLSDPRTIWIGQRLSVPGAGNDAGVAVAYSSPAGSSTYVVKAGDSLSAIAAASGISLDELAALNGIAPLTHVIIGQRLAVPASFGTSATTSTAVNQTPGYNESMHIVSNGQSLGAIANQYGVTTASIIERNGISNPSLVTVGQRLVIPNAQVQATNSAHAGGFPSNVSFPPTSGKWIRVDLSTQQLTAYVGSIPQQVFTISSGLPETPTVTGTFHIWSKLAQQDMKGGSRFAGTDYDLPDVPWVQYFHRDYAFHGAYWHNNFGTPMSNGCVNMRIWDAKWLFEWAGPNWGGGWQEATSSNPGTLVIVHP